MMRTMRANAKWIMVGVAVAFVGWMVFDVGMDIGGQGGGGSPTEVARINGTKIDVQTFYTAVRNAQEQQRQAGAPIFTLEDQRALEDRVLESFVQQIALRDEYERRDIRVTDDEIRQAAMTTPLSEMLQVPDFQTDGEFDFGKYQRFLRTQSDLGFMLAIEGRYRDLLPQQKLLERVQAGVFVPDSKLWRIYQDQYDSVATRIVTILPQAVIRDDDVEVSDDEVTEYYRSHREDYRRPARATMSFVSVSRETNSADSVAALARTQRVLEELRGGADFEAVTARESADLATRQTGGDLGEVTKGGTLIAAFEEAALALRPGQISEPVLTEFGYHIIRLESKSGDKYHPRHILIPIEPDGEHLREVEARADSLDLFAAEQDDPTALDSTAASLGIPVAVAPPLVEGNRLRLGAYLIPDVGIWAFETFEGESSPVIETNHAFYVFRLDRLEPEGVPPLDEIREAVTRDVLTEKKWEKAEDLAQQIDADLRAGILFINAAVRRGLRPLTLAPFTRIAPNPALNNAPEVVGAVFGLEVGESSGPIKTERAIFFVEPTAKQPADSSQFAEEIDQFRDQILRRARQIRVQLMLSAIRADASFVDLRRELAQAQRDLARSPFAQSPLGF